jgi:hypothetical protein
MGHPIAGCKSISSPALAFNPVPDGSDIDLEHAHDRKDQVMAKFLQVFINCMVQFSGSIPVQSENDIKISHTDNQQYQYGGIYIGHLFNKEVNSKPINSVQQGTIKEGARQYRKQQVQELSEHTDVRTIVP